ncbi:Hopanoid C-3 methylase [subsurface metagenome]
MRVLLVQPPSHSALGLQAFSLPEPLGLETIAACLTNEHEVSIFDMRIEHNIWKKLSLFKPDVVGVSASFTADVYSAYKVLDRIKEYSPRVRTFVGGHHATMCHIDFSGRADVVVLGEGEITTAELLRFWERGEPINEVEGIAYQGSNGWIQTKPRPLIQNLDDIPLPARYLIKDCGDRYFIGKRRPCAIVETSRGCPHRCKFCSVWRFYKGSNRSHTPEMIVRELQHIKAPHIMFVDDNFFADDTRAENILFAINKAAIKKRYIMQIRVDSILNQKEMIGEWAASGLDAVLVGVESINQQKLNGLGKRLEADKIEDALKVLHETGILAMASFIVDPDFKVEDFIRLRQYVKRARLVQPYFSVLTPLPGTVLHEERAKDISSNNYELFDLHHAVLPTKLGLKKFYREYTKLWVYTYFLSPPGVSGQMRNGVKNFSRLVWIAFKLLIRYNPGALLRHHRQQHFHK